MFSIMIKKHIPNIITLLNLLCGSIAVLFAVQGYMLMTALFVVLGIVFDYFDGFAARMLNVKSELGLQLDSLADMVTSGVVPGVVMYKMLQLSLGLITFRDSYNDYLPSSYIAENSNCNYFTYIGLLITLASCYRLAKFNIDTRQTDSFIGLPTPIV